MEAFVRLPLPTATSRRPSMRGRIFLIPKGTPFQLTATGSDSVGEILTFCWEERDLGSSASLTSPDNGSSPLFRSFAPSVNPSRYFPSFPTC